MSVNLELPTADGLRKLAPHKSRQTILRPMKQIQQQRDQNISFQGNFLTKLVRNSVQSYCVTAGQAFVRASGKNCCISAGTGAVNSMGIPETGCEKDRFQECRL